MTVFLVSQCTTSGICIISSFILLVLDSMILLCFSSINSYSSNSGAFKFTSLLSAVGVFIGVFGGSFAIGTLMALLTSIVSLHIILSRIIMTIVIVILLRCLHCSSLSSNNYDFNIKYFLGPNVFKKLLSPPACLALTQDDLHQKQGWW